MIHREYHPASKVSFVSDAPAVEVQERTRGVGYAYQPRRRREDTTKVEKSERTLEDVKRDLGIE